MIEAPPRADAGRDPAPLGEQALFPEARRLRRRRWVIRAAIVITLVGAAAVVVWLTAARGGTPAQSHRETTPGTLPTGPVVTLHVAGALAVGPTGALYVADVARHRILVRTLDGRFRVVAGTGTPGFAGDGGSALHAELSAVSDLTFSAAGSLYFVDGGRVREITPDGVIHTIAGDGRPAHHIASGSLARSAALGSVRSLAAGDSLSIALSPSGRLSIATASQLLRLTPQGTLATVRAIVPSGVWRGRLKDLGQIAIDAHGDIVVSGVNGWSVWQVTPGGLAHQVGRGSGARLSGGGESNLQRGPGGAVYAENGPTILRVASRRLIPMLKISGVHHEYFWPTNFAFGPRGAIYADELPGDDGFEAHQQLVSIRDGRARLLWQEHNPGGRDSFDPG